MNPNTSPNDLRRPELLAGYADGEISPADRAAVEAWIAADPTAQAELELQQRLSLTNTELWTKAAPPLPSEADWNRVMGGIHNRLRPASPAPSYRTAARWTSQRLSAATAIAAGLLIAVGAWYLSNSTGDNGSLASGADVFQIVHADDITIMDLEGDDRMLVVGRSPLTGPIDLVTIGDTELWAISNDPSETPSKPNFPAGNPNQPRWWNTTTPVP